MIDLSSPISFIVNISIFSENKIIWVWVLRVLIMKEYPEGTTGFSEVKFMELFRPLGIF
jgi:hypothetical protein